MSGRVPDWTLTHWVDVEPLIGHAGAGPVYGPAVRWRCLRVDKRRTSRSANDREVTSDVQLYLPPEAAGQVPPESRVTVDDERTAYVVEVREHLHPDLPTPDHVHLLCGRST